MIIVEALLVRLLVVWSSASDWLVNSIRSGQNTFSTHTTHITKNISDWLVNSIRSGQNTFSTHTTHITKNINLHMNGTWWLFFWCQSHTIQITKNIIFYMNGTGWLFFWCRSKRSIVCFKRQGKTDFFTKRYLWLWLVIESNLVYF